MSKIHTVGELMRLRKNAVANAARQRRREADPSADVRVRSSFWEQAVRDYDRMILVAEKSKSANKCDARVLGACNNQGVRLARSTGSAGNIQFKCCLGCRAYLRRHSMKVKDVDESHADEQQVARAKDAQPVSSRHKRGRDHSRGASTVYAFVGAGGGEKNAAAPCIHEVPVYCGAMKVYRVLNIITGTVYSNEHETLDQAMASIKDGEDRGGRIVKKWHIRDVHLAMEGYMRAGGQTPSAIPMIPSIGKAKLGAMKSGMRSSSRRSRPERKTR